MRAKTKRRKPQSSVLRWVAWKFGVKGLENLTPEEELIVLKALYIVLKRCGWLELDYLGLLMGRLASNRLVAETILKHLTKEVNHGKS